MRRQGLAHDTGRPPLPGPVPPSPSPGQRGGSLAPPQQVDVAPSSSLSLVGGRLRGLPTGSARAPPPFTLPHPGRVPVALQGWPGDLGTRLPPVPPDLLSWVARSCVARSSINGCHSWGHASSSRLLRWQGQEDVSSSSPWCFGFPPRRRVLLGKGRASAWAPLAGPPASPLAAWLLHGHFFDRRDGGPFLLCPWMFLIVIAMDYSLPSHRFGYHPSLGGLLCGVGFGGLWRKPIRAFARTDDDCVLGRSSPRWRRCCGHQI